MSESSYWELSLQLTDEMKEMFDSISEVASISFECSGILAFSLDEPMVDELMGEKSYSGGNLPEDFSNQIVEQVENEDPIRVFYFHGDGAEVNVRSFLEYLENHFEGVDGKIVQKESEDWNQSWREHYSPITVSSNLEIVPSWMKDSHQSGAIHQIYIYPGQGFGTGDHQTTYLCLKIMDELIEQGSGDIFRQGGVLDFGSGSGILGIAAMKTLSGISVDFYDIDQEAMDNCQENIDLNFKQSAYKNVRLLLPPDVSKIEENPNYGLIFANILIDVLLDKRDYLENAVVKEGYLILSGILREQGNEIIEAYSSTGQLKLIDKKAEGDWMALAFQRI